jgi:hypothetical protein
MKHPAYDCTLLPLERPSSFIPNLQRLKNTMRVFETLMVEKRGSCATLRCVEPRFNFLLSVAISF